MPLVDLGSLSRFLNNLEQKWNAKLEARDFIVTVTVGDIASAGVYSANIDKTFAEILEAYNSGRNVIAKLGPVILTLSMISEMGVGMCVFTGVYNVTNTGALMYGLSYNGSSWILYQYNTPSELKNPNALTIKFGNTTITYDGSEAKTIDLTSM